MTSASAQDRVHQLELLYRDAQIKLVAAQEVLDTVYGALCEARVLAQPQFNVEPLDERSVAERQADGWRQRGDVEVLP